MHIAVLWQNRAVGGVMINELFAPNDGRIGHCRDRHQQNHHHPADCPPADVRKTGALA
jgi:hypothetical protein